MRPAARSQNCSQRGYDAASAPEIRAMDSKRLAPVLPKGQTGARRKGLELHWVARVHLKPAVGQPHVGEHLGMKQDETVSASGKPVAGKQLIGAAGAADGIAAL